MPKIDDKTRLLHIQKATQTVLSFTYQKTKTDLESDIMLVFAVIRGLEIIGEAASRISDEQKSKASNIPWRAITAMRNRLIHGYFDVDIEQVWKVVDEDLIVLQTEITKLLEQFEE